MLLPLRSTPRSVRQWKPGWNYSRQQRRSHSTRSDIDYERLCEYTPSRLQTATNDLGDYEVPSLRVGVYTIKASAPGFSDAVAENITIAVGGRERIDLGLKVGSAQTTVEVTDVAIQIETETVKAQTEHLRTTRARRCRW